LSSYSNYYENEEHLIAQVILINFTSFIFTPLVLELYSATHSSYHSAESSAGHWPQPCSRLPYCCLSWLLGSKHYSGFNWLLNQFAPIELSTVTKVAVDKFKLNLVACSIAVIGLMSCLISGAAGYSIMIFKLSWFDCNSGTEAADYPVGFGFAAAYRLASSCFGCY